MLVFAAVWAFVHAVMSQSWARNASTASCSDSKSKPRQPNRHVYTKHPWSRLNFTDISAPPVWFTGFMADKRFLLGDLIEITGYAILLIAVPVSVLGAVVYGIWLWVTG